MDKKKNVIMQSNRIVRAKQHFTSREKKLFIQLILNIKPSDEVLEYEINGDVFANLIGITMKHRRDEIKRLMEGFQGKTCTIEELDGSWKIYSICPNSEYDSRTNTIRLELNNRLRDDFIGLQKNFTAYYLEDILSLQGTYSARVYEILLELRDYKTLKWEGTHLISDLRDMLLGEKSKKYPRDRDFIPRAIESSINEINEKTQLNVSFEKIKEGRSYKKIMFSVREGLFPKDKIKQPSLAL